MSQGSFSFFNFLSQAARRERTDPRYRVDFVCVHWYPDPNDNINVSDSNVGEIAAQKLERYLIDTYEKYHKRIWLTEFALIDFNHGEDDVRQASFRFSVVCLTTMPCLPL